jgi:hypothetical protein
VASVLIIIEQIWAREIVKPDAGIAIPPAIYQREVGLPRD